MQADLVFKNYYVLGDMIYLSCHVVLWPLSSMYPNSLIGLFDLECLLFPCLEVTMKFVLE